MIKLAIVSPCYNEEDVLQHSVERLTELLDRMVNENAISSDSMMVFVNDGSKDRTWLIISELHQKNRYVRGQPDAQRGSPERDSGGHDDGEGVGRRGGDH